LTDVVQVLTTVVVVHDADAPAKQATVTLCDEHLVALRRATWASIDELIGFSAVMGCEACPLIDNRAVEGCAGATESQPRHPYLRPLPTRI
jgi:hypothetical protein